MDLQRAALTLLFSIVVPALHPDAHVILDPPNALATRSEAAGDSQAAAGSAATEGTPATRVGTLPEATASFGAVASGGWMYVYGGHVSATHSYSIEAVSGSFHRWNLSTGAWEALPGGPGLQGVGLAAHEGRIYRAGGMQPRNRKGEPEDQRSVADVARFDPATRQWMPLPPLIAPHSSHDVVIAGNQLFVIGGWTMRGKERRSGSMRLKCSTCLYPARVGRACRCPCAGAPSSPRCSARASTSLEAWTTAGGF